MVKVRLWGELEEVNALAEVISKLSPKVRILSCSKNYSDRGASVYSRVYMDLKLHELPPDFEIIFSEVEPQAQKDIRRLEGGAE